MCIKRGLGLLGRKLEKEGKGKKIKKSPIRILQCTLGSSGTFVSLLRTFVSLFKFSFKLLNWSHLLSTYRIVIEETWILV